jgi:hypothetical protein
MIMANWFTDWMFGSGGDVSQQPTMTPEQQEVYNQLLQQLSTAQAPNFVQQPSWDITEAPTYTGYTPQYQVTQAPSWENQGMMNQALQSALSGKPAYEITPETTEQYYQDVIYEPAMTEYERTTRPGMLESLGSLHGSTRANLERTSRQDLAQQLRGERSSLYYQDEQARRQALENAAQRQLGGITAGTQMRAQDINQWQIANQLGLSQDQLKSQFGLGLYGQQADIWQAQNQLGLSQDQLNLLYQQAQLTQSQIPIQNLLAALGLTGVENVVTGSTNPALTVGLNLNTA